jgi:hypothetical protein
MKLLLENWRKYLTEEEYRAAAMGSEGTPAKEQLINKFPELKNQHQGQMQQLATTLLNPEQKPLYAGSVAKIPDGFSKEFMEFIRSVGLEYAEAQNTQAIYDAPDLYFVGTPENVKKAVQLQNTPYIGIEKLQYPPEFIEWVKKVHWRHLPVTPEFHRIFGILLGYGEEKSEAFAEKTIKPRWDEAYQQWSAYHAADREMDDFETEVL